METIFLFLIVIIILIAIRGIYKNIFQSSKMDEEVARTLLRKEIDEKYPTLKRSKALSSLYEETLRRFILEKKQGNDVKELENKLRIILNELIDEISDEIERESTYVKLNK